MEHDRSKGRGWRDLCVVGFFAYGELGEITRVAAAVIRGAHCPFHMQVSIGMDISEGGRQHPSRVRLEARTPPLRAPHATKPCGMSSSANGALTTAAGVTTKSLPKGVRAKSVDGTIWALPASNAWPAHHHQVKSAAPASR